MNIPRKIPGWPLWLAGLLLVCATPVLAVTVGVGDGAGGWGETVTVPVYLADVTGPIYSVEVDLSWYQHYLDFTGVETAGTFSEFWSVEFHSTAGQGQLALAGATPIETGGVLCYLEFVPVSGSGNAIIYVDQAFINENPVPAETENGSINITPDPTLNVYPDESVLPVGETLAFNTTGGTAPYTYTSSDPAVAEFTNNDNILYALGPGTVQVTSQDQGGYSDTTTGFIEVRPFILQALDSAGTEGQTVQVPLILMNPGPYGIYSAELEITWDYWNADFVGVATAGSLMEFASWTVPEVRVADGHIFVVSAGASPLPGPGVLCFLEFEPGPNSFMVRPEPGLFNEQWQSYPLNGQVAVTPLPTLTLSPPSAVLFVGDEITLTLDGLYTPPLDWIWADPQVIDVVPVEPNTAIVTGLSAARAEVWATDLPGARSNTVSIEVYDFSMPSIDRYIYADQTALVPVDVGKELDDLDIFSFELSVNYNSYYTEFLGAVSDGAACEDWGVPLAVDEGGQVKVYHAGSTKLEGCPAALVYLEFRGRDTIGGGGVPAASLAAALFNEGSPRVLINHGGPCSASAVPPVPAARSLRVSNHPNPFNPGTTVSYAVGERGGPARLAVYTPRGELVRVLLDQTLEPGAAGTVSWDGRNQQGRLQPSGVYFSRLEIGGQSALGKMMLLK